jgi:hypothetical protein
MNSNYESSDPVIEIAESLKGCDLYLATGSNSTMSIYGQYFAQYPHLLRRNKTSVAVLSGHESREDLLLLMEDIHAYFGLGCRNVTKIYVPKDYSFETMIDLYKVKNYFADHHKYKNNYDYNLAIALLNKVYYMTDGHLIYLENSSIFSPISCLYYEYYTDPAEVVAQVQGNDDIQCHIGLGGDPFGSTQKPRLDQFSDGLDTMDFLTKNY